MKSTRDSDMLTDLEISRIVYLRSLSIISLTLRHLPCLLQTQVGFICDGLCARQKFLFSHTNCLIRYLIGPINFSQFSKNLHYQMTKILANCFILSSNFFNILNPIQNHFYNSGQVQSHTLFLSRRISNMRRYI